MSFVATENEKIIQEYELQTTRNGLKGVTKVHLTSRRIAVENTFDQINIENGKIDLGNIFSFHEIPVKQIGTCKVKNQNTKIKKGNKIVFLISLIALLLTVAFLGFWIFNYGLKDIATLLFIGFISILSLIMAIYNFPKTRITKEICLYVESTKDENSLVLDNLGNNENIAIDFTEENLTKIIDIFHKINEIRK